MLGLRAENPRTKPMSAKPERSGPTLLPDAKRVDRKVFLTEDQWERLSFLAEFHEEAFRKLGNKQSVSRNDIIEDFLSWAEGEYWADLGGKPTTPGERDEKIALLVEKITAKEKAKAKANRGLGTQSR